MRRDTLYLSLTILTLILLVAVSSLGPEEATLGINVRSVYLHGAWVWTALISFIAAGLFGSLALLFRQDKLHAWSTALGRAGTFFWVTYLPLSLWTMKLNWNGLFLEEPRWRVSLDFLIVGILFQTAIFLLKKPALSSILNISFISALGWTLLRTDQVMHPGSPILSSETSAFQIFFLLLVFLCTLAGLFLVNWFRTFSPISS
jgi:hypothetical protein